ncbi:MAG: gliding motility-associated C-terminal domain-containing protein [Saprospiraceae bacterium]|nr:gliding motility-associated C-terminal domain-containing protein [Saprospiraceae bacterium]
MKYILILIIFSVCILDIKTQTTIFTNPGASYTNLDLIKEDNYNNIDISTCTSIRFSMDFSFSDDWLGPGNMESFDECPFSSPTCNGDPLNPSPDCAFCWDFMYIELIIDGVVVQTELIGIAGETRQFGSINWILCTNNASIASIRILNTNWTSAETNTFSNIKVECWDAKPTATAMPTPLCAGDDLNLNGTIAVPADAMSWLWTVTGAGSIVSPASLMTSVNNAENGDTYTLTVTDDNSCTASSSVTVVVNPTQDPSFTHSDFCAPTSGTASGIATPGGTFSFDPIPADGAMINSATGVISNAVGGTTYNVKYVTPGPCPGEQIVDVMAIPGPSGTLSGSATLCPGECATFSFNFTSGNEPYTINLTASPPGFPLPPIPGVTASQQFTICYQGAGPFPTFDPSTFTINIPTIFSGSGNLNLTGISDGSGCPGTASGGFSLTLTSGPTALPAGPLTACADINGNGTFDLTSLENSINGGNASLIVNWYEDITLTIPISNPASYISSGGTFYATVTSGACESAPIAITLVVNTNSVPFISMVCAALGLDICNLCITNGMTDLEFSFGNNDVYIVTIRDNTTGVLHTGNVINGGTISVPVVGSTTFELISIQPLSGCPNFASYGDIVTINIIIAPDIDPVSIPPSCQPIALPNITGSNLSGNQSYFTGQNGSGTMYNAGDLIFTSQTLYIFDTNAGCDDEEVITVIIEPLISINEIADISTCVSAVLPPITGSGLSTSTTYNTNPLGSGTNYAPGSVVTQSVTLYVFDPNADPNCLGNSVDLLVTIHPLPTVPLLSSVVCTGAEGTITINAPLGPEYQYQLDGSSNQSTVSYNNIGNGTHTITVTNSITGCQNNAQFTVNCNCATPATLSLMQNTGSVCKGDSLFINNVAFGGAATEVILTTNGTGSFSATSFTTSPFNFIYIPSADDVGKTINLIITTNDPDGVGSCAPESLTYQLNVRENPIGSIVGSQLVCLGNDITLTASGGLTYIWSENGGMANTATYQNIVMQETFYVTLTDAFGCRDTVEHKVNVRQISAGRDSLIGYCNTTPTIVNLNNFLSFGTTNGGIWKNGTDTIFNFSNYVITNLPLGFTTLSYLLDDPICGKDTSLIRVNIRNSNNAGMDASDEFCSGFNYRTSLVNKLGNFDGTGTWVITPFTTKIKINLPDIEVNDPPVGRYLVQYIIPFNGCNADTSTLTIDILPKPDAGRDSTITSCIGVDIDLFSLIRSSDLSGSIRNSNSYPGLSGNIWSTAGLVAGTYTFDYFLPSANILCSDDAAILTINLESALSAGIDQVGKFCEGETIDLKDYISQNATPGGIFYYQNQIVPNGVITPTGTGLDFVFTYEVGDDIFCPKKTALITLRREAKPSYTSGIANDICAGDCLTISNSHNASSGSTFYFSMQNTDGTFKQNVSVVSSNSGPVSLPICSNNTGPFNFYLVPVGQSFTLKIDSIQTSSGCKFVYNNNLSFKTLTLPVKTINPLICKEDSLTIGTKTFSFINPTDTFIKPSISSNACDTLVTVSLRFYDQPTGQYTTSECDETKTYPIGDDQIFTFANPSGMAKIKGGSIFGCDSIVLVNIKYEKREISGNFTSSTCRDTFEYRGELFYPSKPSGSIRLPGAAIKGCDSLVNVQIDFSEFIITEMINYQCDGSDPQLVLNLASHPGPYTISLDGNIIGNPAAMPYATPITIGSHTVVVTNQQGCSESFSIDVEDKKGPNVVLSQTPNLDGTVQIITTAPQNVIYDLAWTPSNTLSCNDCLNPIANPTITTTYILEYLYGNQCPDQRQITIERFNTEIILPNIFSPNGDNNNDVFFVQFPEKASGIVKSMAIYDRWGNLVFSAKDKPGNSPTDGWHGNFGSADAELGVYVYFLEVQIDGKAGIDTYAGSITLIR